MNGYKIGDRVTVAHEMGREAGTVIGVQTDPTGSHDGWVRVEFADRTNSAWPLRVVTPARAANGCRVCGSSAPILRESATRGTLSLCYHHEAVCWDHLVDPCPTCL